MNPVSSMAAVAPALRDRVLSYKAPLHSRSGMGFRRLDRISDFRRHEIGVQVFCTVCENKQTFDPDRFFNRAYTRRDSDWCSKIEKRLRCSKCRQKRARIQAGWPVER